MKTFSLLLALSVILLNSCTTAYKSGQTPDDVYYSAAKPQDEYVESEKERDRSYRYDDEYYDNRYLRMKVRNRYRWDDLDGWYGYDRYSIGYNYYFGSYYNPYNTWNYFYNPYCHPGYIYYNPKTPVSQPLVKRHFSLTGYTNTAYNNTNNSGLLKTSRNTTTRPVYDNNNYRTNTGLGDKVRTIFSNDNSGSGSSRTYNPSSSGSSGTGGSRGSSGSSGSSGGGGGVSRPTRN